MGDAVSMSSRPFSTALAWVCALSALASPAWGQVAGSEPASESRAVRAWLMRIHEAAGHRNFQGTFVVSGGGAVSSSRIAHFCEGSNQYERIESLDGQERLVLRNNDVVINFRFNQSGARKFGSFSKDKAPTVASPRTSSA